MRVEILEISTYNAGQFLVQTENGEQCACILENKDRDWDKLYDHLTGYMNIRATKIGPAHFVVHEIY